MPLMPEWFTRMLRPQAEFCAFTVRKRNLVLRTFYSPDPRRDKDPKSTDR